MKQQQIGKILAEIENGYDQMSAKFSDTRKYFWRSLEFLKNYTKDGDRIFDFGCGNGRLLELFQGKKMEYYGVDVSGKLIELAKNKYLEKNVNFSKISPSQGSLPFPDNFFNTAYAIAVFHHFPGKEYREAMAKELYRITKPGGYVIITVWNLWPVRNASRSDAGRQRKYIGRIIKNWQNKILRKSFLDWNDCYITFNDNQGNVFQRYHHAFTKKELARLFVEAGFKKEKIIVGKNLIFIGKK